MENWWIIENPRLLERANLSGEASVLSVVSWTHHNDLKQWNLSGHSCYVSWQTSLTFCCLFISISSLTSPLNFLSLGGLNYQDKYNKIKQLPCWNKHPYFKRIQGHMGCYGESLVYYWKLTLANFCFLSPLFFPFPLFTPRHRLWL